MGAGRYLAEYHFIVFHKQLHTEYAVTAEGVSHLFRNFFCVFKRFLAHRLRLPAVAVVTVYLHMAYGLAVCGAAHASYREQGYLVVEIHESFHNYPSGTGAATFLGGVPCGVYCVGRFYSALSVTRRTHDGFHHAGNADFFHSLLEFLVGRGEAVGRSLHAKFLGCKAAYAFAVHGEPCRCGGGGHVVALFLKFHEGRGGYRLNLGNDMVGFLAFYHFAQCLAVEHVQHIVAVGHLHGGCVGITVACHYLHIITLKLYCHFFTKFATAKKQSLPARAGHNRSYFSHFS